MNEEIEIDEWASWLSIIFITLFGGWLRVLLLADKGMWLGETFSGKPQRCRYAAMDGQD